MKFIFAIVFCVSFSNSLFAQKIVINEYAAIDKKAISIPDSLTKTTNNLSKYINNNFQTDAFNLITK